MRTVGCHDSVNLCNAHCVCMCMYSIYVVCVHACVAVLTSTRTFFATHNMRKSEYCLEHISLCNYATLLQYNIQYTIQCSAISICVLS